MLRELVAVAGACLCAPLANGAPRAPQTLLIDACGQIRDNALRIWSDQIIISIRQSRNESKIVYCFVAGVDRDFKQAFAVNPATGDSNGAGREALKAACDQMQVNRNNVFGGRRVYFTEDPDIKVVYCLVRTPQPTDMPEVEVSDPPLVDTVELLFMSYYGEPLDKGL